jgi:hypothetical protein
MMKLAEIHGNYKSQLITLQFRSPQYLPIHIPCHYKLCRQSSKSCKTCSVQNVVTNDAILHQDIHWNVHDSPSFWVVVAAHDEETLEELIEVINDHEDISSVLL